MARRPDDVHQNRYVYDIAPVEFGANAIKLNNEKIVAFLIKDLEEKRRGYPNVKLDGVYQDLINEIYADPDLMWYASYNRVNHTKESYNPACIAYNKKLDAANMVDIRLCLEVENDLLESHGRKCRNR